MNFYSTPTLKDEIIEKHLGFVSAHYVVGANVFKDIIAEFRDILGGKNKAYQNVLKDLEAYALQDLERKTKKLGGNAVIGLTIDQDEVSGGTNNQMFMIKAYGTAVKIDESSIQESIHDIKEYISREKFESAKRHLMALKNLEGNDRQMLNDVKQLSLAEFPSERTINVFFDWLINYEAKVESNGSETVSLIDLNLRAIPEEMFEVLMLAKLDEEWSVVQTSNLARFYKATSGLPLNLIENCLRGGDAYSFGRLVWMIVTKNPEYYSKQYVTKMLKFKHLVQENTSQIDAFAQELSEQHVNYVFTSEDILNSIEESVDIFELFEG